MCITTLALFHCNTCTVVRPFIFVRDDTDMVSGCSNIWCSAYSRAVFILLNVFGTAACILLYLHIDLHVHHDIVIWRF